MKWFDKWFAKKCKQAWIDSAKNDREEDITAEEYLMKQPFTNIVTAKSRNLINRGHQADFNRSNAMNFILHPATGGHILEYNSYDKKTDDYQQRLHLIPDDIEMGEAIAKIITMELLRK